MAWVQIWYKDDPLGEEKSRRLEGKSAGYQTLEDFYFVRIWADKETFTVPKEKVLSIEHSEE